MERAKVSGVKGSISGGLIIVAANDQASADLEGEAVILSVR
jgi:hypothetical protein